MVASEEFSSERGNIMKSIIALAALAAIGFAGAAYAGDATAPKAMSDSEMDKVTAGEQGGGPNAKGYGTGSGFGLSNPNTNADSSVVPGFDKGQGADNSNDRSRFGGP
jgi:hypothetical protein